MCLIEDEQKSSKNIAVKKQTRNEKIKAQNGFLGVKIDQ